MLADWEWGHIKDALSAYRSTVCQSSLDCHDTLCRKIELLRDVTRQVNNLKSTAATPYGVQPHPTEVDVSWDPRTREQLVSDLNKHAIPRAGSFLFKSLEKFLKHGMYVPAIRWVRTVYDLGLREAKEIVDKYPGSR